jgi:L-2,4-diaminobutyrate decarboxylase
MAATRDSAHALLRGEPAEENRAFLEAILDLGMRFASGEVRGRRPLVYAEPEQLAEAVAEPLPRGGLELDELAASLAGIARYSIAQGDPHYLAFPDAGNSVAAIGADLLATFLNQNLIAVDRSAPVGTFVEAQVILWLRELIGYTAPTLTEIPNALALGGMWTPGGNLSNHVAVLTALQRHFPEIRDRGLTALSGRPLIVLAKGIEHFSYLGAARTLGLGGDALVWAPAGRDHTTDVDALERALDAAPDDGVPFMAVAVAGNCRTTGIDDITALREVCDRHGVWLHVDACHGGSLLFSERHRHRLAGIDLADSVSLDPHKGFFVTYPSSYLLCREPHDFLPFARYPNRVDEPGAWDLGLLTPFFGSRPFASLKLWALIRHLGSEGIARLVDERQRSYERVVRAVDRTGWFTFISDPSFYRSALVFLPALLRSRVAELRRRGVGVGPLRHAVDRHTEAFSDDLYRRGRVIFDLFSLADLDDRVGLGAGTSLKTIGICVGHPELGEEDVRAIVGELDAVAPAHADCLAQELDELEAGAPVTTAGDAVHGPAGW